MLATRGPRVRLEGHALHGALAGDRRVGEVEEAQALAKAAADADTAQPVGLRGSLDDESKPKPARHAVVQAMMARSVFAIRSASRSAAALGIEDPGEEPLPPVVGSATAASGPAPESIDPHARCGRDRQHRPVPAAARREDRVVGERHRHRGDNGELAATPRGRRARVESGACAALTVGAYVRARADVAVAAHDPAEVAALVVARLRWGGSEAAGAEQLVVHRQVRARPEAPSAPVTYFQPDSSGSGDRRS